MPDQDLYASLGSIFFPYSSELYSQIFYNKLNNLNDFSAYFERCEKLSSIRKYKNVKITCAKLLKYLESETISRNTDKYDVCMLLNFWVYSRLFNVLNPKGINVVNIAYGELQQIWNDFIDNKLRKPENETCKPIHNLALYNDWKERKELYEHYVDYDDFSKTLVGWPERCKEFYKYVESKKTLYEHFNKDCPSENEYKCPNFYSEYEKYHPDTVLSQLICHEEMKNKHSSPAVVASSVESRPDMSAGRMLRNGFGWNNNMRNLNGADNRLFDYASESFNPYSGGAEEHYIGYHPA
ncbi:hypothetical protein PVIIG_03428 [Plasmodium vivax India VII]|uniref:Variable surface protein Vir4 n=1 Tax=Plasmodium vivax India VII TaxID=1077284 RepID=A0A0J9SGR9_PLAVI|nr:hypothetical protein PVIIG_03428 [Plasmodium vivax India VII]